MFIWEEVISGNVSREWGSEPGKGRQPVQSVTEPWITAGSQCRTCALRHPEGQGSWGAPTPIPWHFHASGLPQGTKEDVEAGEDLQAKKCWCWQWEARHMCTEMLRRREWGPVCSAR